MVGKRGLILITCQNPDCAYVQIEEGKDITKNGHNKAGNQQYYCHHCGKYFIETRNTPLYHSRLPRSEVLIIAKHAMEKTSIRGVSRVINHHRDTISRYYHLIGEHAEKLNDHYIRDIPAGDCEMDEIWGFIQKKNKNLQMNDPEEYGDCWTYTSFKRESGLFIAFQTGKRIESTCADMLDLFFDRMNLPTPNEKISIYSDGNVQYTICIPELYCEPCINYGQLVKVKKKNSLVCVIREKVLGNPHVSSISTSVVEGYNNKIRQRLSRFGRKTASFSKKTQGFIAALNIFQFVHNFY